ncbi:YceI-like domain-containing protein [Dyadobacter soli]|uniref:YceI-like domain-containing protein n=1 Tax=Dyadobacter soli TaxID=659014 RepID=A0A1G7M8W5_9BACT|nr:YceI family protein [Dyadobacter soli]SDF57630.1 YceI-like domain-containing protein [Dyadobacter soli]
MDTRLFKLAFLLMASQLLAICASAQIYMTKTGQTSFFSETPLENISAVNQQVAVLLSSASGEIAVRMQHRAFSFPNKLMQEHYNENYMETAKYPAASFTGKINEHIDYGKDGTFTVSAEGVLDIHGVKQKRVLRGQLVIDHGQCTLTSEFDVRLTDHNIQVPTLVIAKIAESISVKNKFVLTLKKNP